MMINSSHTVAQSNENASRNQESETQKAGQNSAPNHLMWALKYASMGWHVFPVRPPVFNQNGTATCSCKDGAKCKSIGKHPRVFWSTEATTDSVIITDWWKRWPQDNIGIATGPSGLAVIDLDGPEGATTFNAIAPKERFIDLASRSGRSEGGYHLWFRVPKDISISSKTNGIGEKVDIKADGGYIVAPPSLHKTGNRYSFYSDFVEPGELPPWLLELLLEKQKTEKTSHVNAGLKISKEDLESLLAKARNSKKALHKLVEPLEKVIAGEAYAKPGGRDDTTTRLVGSIVGQWPEVDPECVYKLFKSSISKLDQKDNPIDHDKIVSLVERFQSPISSEEIGSIIEDAFGGKRTAPYTTEEVEDFAKQAKVTLQHFSRRWIVRKGNSLYIWFNGSYKGPFVEREFFDQCRKYLAPAMNWVKLWKLGTNKDGNVTFTPKTVNELVHRYGTSADHIQIDLSAKHSFYDVTNHAIVEAPCPIRDLEPTYFNDIDQWLKNMCGDKLEYVEDWLATCMDLTRAAPALYLKGEKSRGKTFFANAIARLWSIEGPTKLVSAMSRFNSSIVRCPLVFGDEGIPKDSRGLPKTQELRELITDLSLRVERKFIPEATTRGSIRLILSANNDDLLKMQGVDLTEVDIGALADRFIAVDVSKDCPILPRDTAEKWIEQDAVARFALWLRENHKVKHADRLACRATSEELIRRMTVNSGIRAAICEHIVNYLMRPILESLDGEPAIRVWDHSVVVNSTLLRRETQMCDTSVFTKNVSSDHIRRGLSALCVGEPIRPRDSINRKRYRIVDVDFLREWVRTSSDIDIADFETTLEELGVETR